MTPIKIVFMIDKLVPAGTQTNLLEIVRNLDSERFRPFVISLSENGSMDEDFKKAGAELITLSVKKAYGLSGLKALKFLISFFKKENIDILQCHFLKADLLGVFAAKFSGVHTVITARRDLGFWRSSRQILINRMLGKMCDCYLANSEAVKQATQQQEGVTGQKIGVIHNGIDANRFAVCESSRVKVREELGLKPEDTVVGLIANMRHTIKGHSDLIQAMPEVIGAYPHVKFLLAGKGPLKEGYQQQVDELNLNANVLFVEWAGAMNQLINAIDISVLPSHTEGFSNAVLESMATEKPVVACAVGGNLENVFEGETGFLVPPRDPKALAEKIMQLAADKNLAGRMGKAGREKVLERFTLNIMVDNYEDFYQKCLKGRA